MNLHRLLIGLFLIGSLPAFFPYISALELDDLDVNEYLTRPTFGLSHENGKKIVEDGFKLNNQTYSISNNFHTPFDKQSIVLGENTWFEAVVFSEKGLRVQEFLFGIPEIGNAHLAEVGVEVWFNFEGEIEKIQVIQDSDVIDEEEIKAIHEKVNCTSFSEEKNCDSIKLSVVFLEPLQDNVMAIKAIDWKNRYQITYLNDGIDVSGDSLNPLPTAMISSPSQKEGLIKLTQSKKYSVLWLSEDGRVFERNTFGSFRQIIDSFQRFEDSGDPRTRNHSGFVDVLRYEQSRALGVFNSTTIESQLPETFAYIFPEPQERINEEIKQIMNDQEKIARKIIEESTVQQRFSNINS